MFLRSPSGCEWTISVTAQNSVLMFGKYQQGSERRGCPGQRSQTGVTETSCLQRGDDLSLSASHSLSTQNTSHSRKRRKRNSFNCKCKKVSAKTILKLKHAGQTLNFGKYFFFSFFDQGSGLVCSLLSLAMSNVRGPSNIVKHQ